MEPTLHRELQVVRTAMYFKLLTIGYFYHSPTYEKYLYFIIAYISSIAICYKVQVQLA